MVVLDLVLSRKAGVMGSKLALASILVIWNYLRWARIQIVLEVDNNYTYGSYNPLSISS